MELDEGLTRLELEFDEGHLRRWVDRTTTATGHEDLRRFDTRLPVLVDLLKESDAAPIQRGATLGGYRFSKRSSLARSAASRRSRRCRWTPACTFTAARAAAPC
jgi:hypothetical protein